MDTVGEGVAENNTEHTSALAKWVNGGDRCGTQELTPGALRPPRGEARGGSGEGGSRGPGRM